MPRPILKALHVSSFEIDASKPPVSSNPLPFAACSSRMVMFSPHVHFPTYPCTLTGAAHSPGTYDRKPILVSPNSCALPERGGRVYGTPKGSYFHPRAYEACDAPEPDSDSEPEAVPDLGLFSSTSESSECDCASPDPLLHVAGAPPLRSIHSQEHVLSFLPHPHPPTPGLGLHPVQRERRKKPRPRRTPGSFRRPEDDGDGCLGGF
ncbi:hypothetical protein C8F01DRAFT_739575 [Mycena amicta]|nr:hypothetical protein C8F01DRAFT_739575 [Mycena amicta]